jgi:ABC-type protease/lipase transport system fused ATPase/permease subunit
LHREGRTVVVVTHRNNLLSIVDRIVVLRDGQVALNDERDKVLAVLQQAAAKPMRPLPAPGSPIEQAVTPAQ